MDAAGGESLFMTIQVVDTNLIKFVLSTGSRFGNTVVRLRPAGSSLLAFHGGDTLSPSPTAQRLFGPIRTSAHESPGYCAIPFRFVDHRLDCSVARLSVMFPVPETIQLSGHRSYRSVGRRTDRSARHVTQTVVVLVIA